MKPFAIFSVLALALPFAAGSLSRRRHSEVAHRAFGDVSNGSFTNARLTYYDVGLGACGKVNVPEDMIVALNAVQFGEGYPGPNCFKSINISYGGQFVEATIMDRCEICPYGGLDLSAGLFRTFAPLAQGVLAADWWFTETDPDPSLLDLHLGK